MSDLYEESDCPEKEKYGLIFQAAQVLTMRENPLGIFVF